METDPEQENIPPSLCTTVSDNISDFYEKSTALEISQDRQNEISISLKSLPSIFSSSVKNVNNYQNSITTTATTCLDLALEGEKLCMKGDCEAGIKVFNDAIKIGTDDMIVLSAIYSQLGNAYFYINNFEKALEFHDYDYKLGKKINDMFKQATALGNLCNTFKSMAVESCDFDMPKKIDRYFEKAIDCSLRELDLGRKLEDGCIEGRALYNLGNVYHARGKKIMSDFMGVNCLINNSMICNYSIRNSDESSNQDSNKLEELTLYFEESIKYYTLNLEVCDKNSDIPGLGRALGQIGNVNYRLGRWDQACEYHEKRLKIAQKILDLPGERRALANLANANAGAGRIEKALYYYKKALMLARQSNESEAEAQACWSMSAAYNLKGEYDLAIQYQRRHLEIARLLDDKIGEHKAWTNLGTLYTKIGNDKQSDQAMAKAQMIKEIIEREEENEEFADDDDQNDYYSESHFQSEIDLSGAKHQSTQIFEGSQQIQLEEAPQISHDIIDPPKQKPDVSRITAQISSRNNNNIEEKSSKQSTFAKPNKIPTSTSTITNFFSTMKRSMSSAKNYKSNQNLSNFQKSQSKRFKNNNSNNADFLQILEQVQCNRIDDQRIALKNKKYLKKSSSYTQNNNNNKLPASSVPQSVSLSSRTPAKNAASGSGYPGTDDIPVFLTKNSRRKDNLESFLNGLAHSQNKRLDSQRAPSSSIHVKEYIPPPDNLVDLQNENSIATQNNSINELRRTFSESVLNSDTIDSFQSSNAGSRVTNNAANPFRRSTTATILSAERNASNNRDRYNTIARTGVTNNQSDQIQLPNEYPVPQDLLNLSDKNSLSNKSSTLSQPKQLSSRRPSEMSELDDNFLNQLNSFQGRRLESQRSTIAVKKIIPRLLEDEKEQPESSSIFPRNKSDTKFKIPANPPTKPLKTSSSGSALIKNLSSGSLGLGKNYKISKSFRSTKTTSKNIAARLKSKTVPDEDMFELLNKVQGHRIDDQRSTTSINKKK